MSEPFVFPVWVIYENPADFPGKFVVRKQQAVGGEIVIDKDCVVCDSIDDARACIPHGRVRLLPHPDDDPVIAETWI